MLKCYYLSHPTLNFAITKYYSVICIYKVLYNVCGFLDLNETYNGTVINYETAVHN